MTRAHAAPSMTSNDLSASNSGSAQVLLGQLAHELSILVRAELETAAVERLPALRRRAREVAVAAAAGVALFFALATTTWAAVRSLDLVVPAWAAALIAAGAWSAITLGLVTLDHPRRLLAALADAGRPERADSMRAARREAEHAVRTTAARLVEAVVHEAAAYEFKSVSELVEREAEAGEAEAKRVLGLIASLTRPGRAGASLLERLVIRAVGESGA